MREVSRANAQKRPIISGRPPILSASAIRFLTAVALLSPSCGDTTSDTELAWFRGTQSDLGSVYRNSLLIMPLTLNNISEVDLKVLDFDVSCGCVASSFEPGLIRPGECQQYFLQLSPPRRMSHLDVACSFFSDNAQLNLVKHRFTGRVVDGPEFDADIDLGVRAPERGVLLDLTYDFSRCGRANLSDTEPIVRVDVTQESRLIDSVTMEDDGTYWAGDVLHVMLRFSPNSSRGVLKGKVIVVLSLPDAPKGAELRFESTITGTFIPQAYFEPAIVSLKMLEECSRVCVKILSDEPHGTQVKEADGVCGPIMWTVIPTQSEAGNIGTVWLELVSLSKAEDRDSQRLQIPIQTRNGIVYLPLPVE